MTILNSPHDPFQGIFFKVKIEGADPGVPTGTLTFAKIEGISEETDHAEYRVGDDPPTPRKLAGLTTFGDVTFEDGLDPDDTMRTWRKLFITGVAAGMERKVASRRHDRYRAQVTVTLEGPSGENLHQFTLSRAWPSGVEYSGMDANSSDVILRTVTFKHEGLTEEPLLRSSGTGTYV